MYSRFSELTLLISLKFWDSCCRTISRNVPAEQQTWVWVGQRKSIGEQVRTGVVFRLEFMLVDNHLEEDYLDPSIKCDAGGMGRVDYIQLPPLS